MPTRAAAAKAAVLKKQLTPPPPAAVLPPTPPPTVKSRKSKAPPTPSTPKTPKKKAPSPPPITRTLYPLGEAAPPLLPAILRFDVNGAVNHLKDVDPRFGRFWEHVPCKPFVPPFTAICPFKTLCTSIIGQQVSWMAARAINLRFIQHFDCDTDQFPTPAQVARADVMALKGVGLSTRKAEYVIGLAEHFVSGQISTELLQNGTDEEIAKQLIAVRGIGQWTVDMFLIFTLRRPDILPVGDLGVQRGLVRWVLAAHNALPEVKAKEGKKAAATKAKYAVKVEEDKTETLVRTPPPQTAGLPPTPISPKSAALRAEEGPATPEPNAPGEVLDVPEAELPVPTSADMLQPLNGWKPGKAAPLENGLSVEVLRSRLGGKKAKGGVYLTPSEMETLTEAWRPYRSMLVYYMWPAGEDNFV